MHSVGDSGANVPAFLAKLWKLVEDPTTDDLISWNEKGETFTIRDQARFARELLPLYYKHNNMASFVRQLNMYGFHKVVGIDTGGLKLDKDEMEFAHACFQRGREYLLDNIKRKISISKQEDTSPKPEIMSRVLSEVRSMKGLQESVDSRLDSMKRENEALWREMASLRQKHMKQQQIVNKLIQFLISIVQPSGRVGLGMKRRYPLMLGEASHSSSSGDMEARGPTISILSPATGPIIHDVTGLVDDAEDLGKLVELPVEPIEATVMSPQISEPLQSDEGLTPVPIYDNTNPDLVTKSLHQALTDEQPDFDTMVGMESTSAPGALPDTSRPLSPDVLVAVDPREVVEASAFEDAASRARSNKENRGKTVLKKPDMSIVIGEPSVLEREELDQHLDSTQVVLDNLREVLSLQGSPLDAATLLGVCDSFSFDPTLAIDPLCWSGTQRPPSPWNRHGAAGSHSDQHSLSPFDLLQTAKSVSLFNTDEPVSMPMSNYLSSELDAYRSGSVMGNEVIAFNNSFDADNSNNIDLLDEDGATTSTPISDKDVDLMQLLGVESTSPSKKRRTN